MTDSDDTTPAASSPTGPPAGAPWQAPRRGERSTAGLAFGLIVLGIGLWYFFDRTLGLEMPVIDWRSAWPVVLIAIGAILVVRSAGRRA